MTDAKVTPYDDKKAVRETWVTDGAGFPRLTQFYYDPEIDSQITTQVDIVQHGTAMTPVAGILDYSERKIDSKHKMRVTNVVQTPPVETTYETRQFTFPGLLMTMEFKLVALATPNRSEVHCTAALSAPFTL